MLKLLVFDLDGTLARLGAGILPENVERLRHLEEKGARIALCSGKPTYYLCGMMRQVGLRAPILVGENGAVIQFGVDLPPREYHVASSSAAAKRSIRLLREAFDAAVPGLWYQPNEVGLTPFPLDVAALDTLQGCIDALTPQLEDVLVYRHCDCFDVTPCGITKKSGLERLGRILGITPEETAAMGNDMNDYPMFEYAGLAVGVNVQDERQVDRNFATTAEALDFLLTQMQNTEIME